MYEGSDELFMDAIDPTPSKHSRDDDDDDDEQSSIEDVFKVISRSILVAQLEDILAPVFSHAQYYLPRSLSPRLTFLQKSLIHSQAAISLNPSSDSSHQKNSSSSREQVSDHHRNHRRPL